MKNAEKHAFKVNDTKLQHKVIEALQGWNIEAGEYQLAIEYGKKNIKVSTGNSYWLAYAYGIMAMTFMDMSKESQAQYYINMSYNCISGVPVKYRGQFYASMGMMFVQSDTNLAKKFFKEGLKYKDAMNYLGLSMLSYIDNDYVAVDSFLNKALFFADKKQKTLIYEDMRQITSSNGDYKSAYEYLCKYDDLVAKNNKEQTESIANTVQVQLDQSLKELEMQNNIFLLLLLSVIIASSVLFIVFRLRHYTMKMKKEKLQYYAMLNLYKNKLKELERQSADKHNRSYEEEIRRRIKKYETQQTQKLNTGHALYINILEKGKNTITWNKKEYESFLKYCKLKEFDYMLQLETDYEGLSPRYQFFIVLQHLGKSEKDIQRIMVISQGAIRTIKSRIRGCKKV